MLRRIVGIFPLTCALGARAFLLPPGIAPSDKTASLQSGAVFPKTATVSIPCPDCAFPYTEEQDAKSEAANDGWFWVQGGANDLLMQFTVSADGRSLESGDSVLYPYLSQSGFRPNKASERSPSVLQVPAGAHADELDTDIARSTRLEATSWSIRAMAEHQASKHGDETITLQYQVAGVNHQKMHLDGVMITLLQLDSGEILIMDVQRTPNLHGFIDPLMEPINEDEKTSEIDLVFEGLPQGLHHGHLLEECRRLPPSLCRLKTMVENKFQKLKGKCHGRPRFRNGKIQSMDESGRPHKHKGRPHHKKPHGPHHAHRPHHGHHGRHGHFRQHSFIHFFGKAFVAVLIPIMAGILVGMTVSFFGLIIGQIISFLWITIVRGGRRGYESVSIDEEAFVDEQRPVEKKPLIAEMEAPPVYEDAPPYEMNSSETTDTK